jgi:hypothetical protein
MRHGHLPRRRGNPNGLRPKAMNTSATKTPGKRPFIAGCVTFLLFSAVQMSTNFYHLFVEPTELPPSRAASAPLRQ